VYNLRLRQNSFAFSDSERNVRPSIFGGRRIRQLHRSERDRVSLGVFPMSHPIPHRAFYNRGRSTNALKSKAGNNRVRNSPFSCSVKPNQTRGSKHGGPRAGALLTTGHVARRLKTLAKLFVSTDNYVVGMSVCISSDAYRTGTTAGTTTVANLRNFAAIGAGSR